MFITENKLPSVLRNLLASASEVRLAVAFWGSGAAVKIGLTQVAAPTRVICNLASGATSPDEMRTIIGSDKVMVRQNNRLHAKVYWTPEGVILGSSNASANGLCFSGSETEGWKEANVLLEDKKTIKQIGQWFDDLWADDETKGIEEEDLIAAKVAREARRRAVSPPPALKSSRRSLLDALLESPDSFSECGIIIRMYEWGEVSPESNQELELARKSFNDDPDLQMYEGWEAAPGTAIIDFHKNGGKWKADEFWQVVNDEKLYKRSFAYNDGSRGELILVKRIRNVRGLVLNGDLRRWFNLVEAIWSDGLELDLGEFGRRARAHLSVDAVHSETRHGSANKAAGPIGLLATSRRRLAP